MQQEMRSSLRPELESLLKLELGNDEEVQWSGRPERGSSAGAANVFTILVIIFSCVGFALLIAATILLTVIGTRGTIIVSIPLFVIGGTFLFLTLLFGIFALVYRNASKNTLYAITNERIIIMRTGPILTVDSYGKHDIGYLTRRERPDGSGDLLFTSIRSPYAYNYNSGTSNTNNGYAYSSGPGSFIGISNVRSVERILRTTFKSDR